MSPDHSKAPFGAINTWAAGVTVPTVDEELILRAWDWYLALLKKDAKLVMGTYVLMEFMQKVTSLSPCASLLTIAGCVSISRISQLGLCLAAHAKSAQPST